MRWAKTDQSTANSGNGRTNMATEIRVPTLGESVAEATVGKWFKKAGDCDHRRRADRGTGDRQGDRRGSRAGRPARCRRLPSRKAETVEVGSLLGSISEGGAPAKKEAKAEPKADEKPAKDDKKAEAAPAKSEGSAKSGDMPAAPSAAKMMAEKNVSADQVEGSGKRGQILKEDVMAAIAKGTSAPAAEAPKGRSCANASRRWRARGKGQDDRLRQTIARRLKDAQATAAMLTTFNEGVDMKPVMDMRKKYIGPGGGGGGFEKKHGVKLGFMGFFSKAVCQALKEIPAVNAEIDGNRHHLQELRCISASPSAPIRGKLVVPVVRDADQMTIAEIEAERSGRLWPGRAGRASCPWRTCRAVLHHLQWWRLRVADVDTDPVMPRNRAFSACTRSRSGRSWSTGQIVIRPMMYLALFPYDHRIVDGKEAVTFLVRVKEILEDPERLVLDL